MSAHEDDKRQRKDFIAKIDSLRLELQEARATIAAWVQKDADAQRTIELDDQIIADRNRILDALPCPSHGPCVPHVLQQIDRFKTDRDRIIALIYEELSHEYMPLVNRLVEKIRALP